MQFDPENKHLNSVSFNTDDAHQAVRVFQPWDDIPRFSITTRKNDLVKSKLFANISRLIDNKNKKLVPHNEATLLSDSFIDEFSYKRISKFYGADQFFLISLMLLISIIKIKKFCPSKEKWS